MSTTSRPIAFSLRTLLALVAMLCAWLAYERSVAIERRTMRAKLNSAGASLFGPGSKTVPPGESPASVRWSRRLFGDEPVQLILFHPNLDGEFLDGEEAAGTARIFPEAKVFVPGRGDPVSPGASD